LPSWIRLEGDRGRGIILRARETMRTLTNDWPVIVGLLLALLVAWFDPRKLLEIYKKLRPFRGGTRDPELDRASRESTLMIPKIDLQHLGELALIASILLSHFFILLSIEAQHFRSELSGVAQIYFVNAPLVMSFILAVTYTISIPVLVSKIIINSNKETIILLISLGAKSNFIASELRSSFVSLMWKVSIKSIIIEFIMYSILIMTISSFTDFIYVNFPRVIALSLASIAIFTGMASLIIYRSGFVFVREVMRSADTRSESGQRGDHVI
jgi:hypothetical protein